MRKELGYLALGLTPLLLITLAQGPLLRYQTSFQSAKQQYLEALQESRRQLADLGHTLRSLPALTDGSGTLSSAGRTLNGFIVPGKIDHIAIYDQECLLVANSDQGLPLSSACPVNSPKSINTPHFQWRNTPHSKSYELIAPLMTIGDKSYFLMASNYLNEQWLFHNREFKQSMNQLDLVMGNASSGKILFKEDTATPNGELATLSSTHPLLQFFPNLIQSKPLDFRAVTGAALAWLLFCLGVLLRELNRKRQAIQVAIQKLYAWAEELVPEGSGTGGSGGSGGGAKILQPLKFSRKGEIDIQILQDRMSRLVKTNLEATERTEHEKRLLQQQMVRLESRYLEAQAEQSFMTKTRSMHQQMHASADAFITTLHDSQSLGEDLSHLTSHEIVKPAQRLTELMQRWEAELNTVTTRKFVRSLSERVDENGVSELDESLNFLMATGSQLTNAAINITLLTQRLLGELQQNTILAQHWFHMMGHDNSIAKTLLVLLQDAQSLIDMQNKPLRFDNVLEPDIAIDHLKIPTSTLTSTLFHCQMALVENAIDNAGVERLGVSNQLRLRDGKVILLSSLRPETVDELTIQKEFSPKAEQHLSMALQMLQGFPIRLTKLPALNGVHAIALMWESEQDMDDGQMKETKGRFEPTHDPNTQLEF